MATAGVKGLYSVIRSIVYQTQPLTGQFKSKDKSKDPQNRYKQEAKLSLG